MVWDKLSQMKHVEAQCVMYDFWVPTLCWTKASTCIYSLLTRGHQEIGSLAATVTSRRL